MKFESHIPTTEELSDELFKILSYKTYDDRKKIDCMLEITANFRSQLGIDSSKKEVESVKRLSRTVYRAIKTVDLRTGYLLLRTQDSKSDGEI